MHQTQNPLHFGYLRKCHPCKCLRYKVGEHLTELKVVPAMQTSQIHKKIEKSQSLGNYQVWQAITVVVLHNS